MVNTNITAVETENKRPIKHFNLQLFAEGDDGGGDTGGDDKGGADNSEGDAGDLNPGTEPPAGESDKTEKSFTQSELDRAVSKAIEKREAKLKAEFEAQIQEQMKKEKKLSEMTEEEKRLSEISEREKAVQEKEMQIKMAEKKSELINELAKVGLPTRASELLLREDDEKTFEALKLFKEVIEESNKAILKAKMGDNEFKPETGKTSELTVESFKKMTYQEKATLLSDNPALYKKLSEEARKPLYKK